MRENEVRGEDGEKRRDGGGDTYDGDVRLSGNAESVGRARAMERTRYCMAGGSPRGLWGSSSPGVRTGEEFTSLFDWLETGEFGV